MTTVTADQLAREAQEFHAEAGDGHPYARAGFVLHGFVRYVRQHWGDHGEAMLADVDHTMVRACRQPQGRDGRQRVRCHPPTVPLSPPP
jgi:hypothetical protein